MINRWLAILLLGTAVPVCGQNLVASPLPDWVNSTPPPTKAYVYFVGVGSDALDEAKAFDRAALDAKKQAADYIQTIIEFEEARETTNTSAPSVNLTRRQVSYLSVSKMRRAGQYVDNSSDKVSVWVLYEVPQSELKKDKLVNARWLRDQLNDLRYKFAKWDSCINSKVADVPRGHMLARYVGKHIAYISDRPIREYDGVLYGRSTLVCLLKVEPARYSGDNIIVRGRMSRYVSTERVAYRDNRSWVSPGESVNVYKVEETERYEFKLVGTRGEWDYTLATESEVAKD